MKPLDWFVLALYAGGMVAIGSYYARRTKSSEDFLLGSRSLNPIMVGLSLFATLMSTLSYLAWPGEMIKHGPLMLGQLLAYPFVAVVVGWFLIPFIMRLKIVSAYEILETRLGPTVRMIGSSMFLSLRIAWMASILFATSDVVLVPMLKLDESWVPWFCVGLGLVTVAYTATGGLRAVVMTDGIQSVIMFLGAFVCIAVVTVHLGGVSAWWPTTWARHWDRPALGFDLGARVSLLGALTSAFTWHLCTSGSDQMAIQRYLATRDIHAARRAMFVSYASDAAISILLGTLGFAILAYYMAQSSADPATLLKSADQLFPRFVLEGLPAGFSGLVIAAILSAAMSSLSSGVNSTCAVIARDFLGRRQDAESDDTSSITELRWLSLAVGAVSITLSIFVSRFEGNLIELCFKVVNLFTAPLFVLFVLAMFVPWATPLGAVLGLAASIAVAVGIAFFGLFGLSFMWMMQASLIVGVVVGMIASLMPFGRRTARL